MVKRRQTGELYPTDKIGVGKTFTNNWLFVGSEHGGDVAAMMRSFGNTCKRLGTNPLEYFHDLFYRIDTIETIGEIGVRQLLPDVWLRERKAQASSK